MDVGDAAGGGGGEELVSQLPGTPHYNSAILEDMCMKEHLTALHGICGDSEAFRDAIILGKVCSACLCCTPRFRGNAGLCRGEGFGDLLLSGTCVSEEPFFVFNFPSCH